MAFVWGYGLVRIGASIAVGLTIVAIELMLPVREHLGEPLIALQLDIERRWSTHAPPSRTAGAAKSTWVV